VAATCEQFTCCTENYFPSLVYFLSLFIRYFSCDGILRYVALNFTNSIIFLRFKEQAIIINVFVIHCFHLDF
jgi:hypothetical protein